MDTLFYFAQTMNITNETFVPIAWIFAIIIVLCGLITVIVTAALWLQKRLNEIHQQLTLINLYVMNSLTHEDMSVWVNKLRADNPDICVPDLPIKTREENIKELLKNAFQK